MKELRNNKLSLALTHIYRGMFVLSWYWSVSHCILYLVIWLNSRVILFFLPLQQRREDFLECYILQGQQNVVCFQWSGKEKHSWPLKICIVYYRICKRSLMKSVWTRKVVLHSKLFKPQSVLINIFRCTKVHVNSKQYLTQTHEDYFKFIHWSLVEITHSCEGLMSFRVHLQPGMNKTTPCFAASCSFCWEGDQRTSGWLVQTNTTR